MKKIMLLAFTAFTLTACDNEAETTTTETDSMALHTTPVTTESSYTPREGDVTYRENRVQVWRGNAWTDADDDVRMENGVVIRRNGTAVRDDREIELEDGVVVDRDGNVFDRTGRALDNAWETTKEGAKEAGDAVGDAARKAHEKVDRVVDDNPND